MKSSSTVVPVRNGREVATPYGVRLNRIGSAPDAFFGVSPAKQAAYLRQAFEIARQNPRIDMMLWFLVRDEPNVKTGWQSGLSTATGKHKPAWNAYLAVPRGS